MRMAAGSLESSTGCTPGLAASVSCMSALVGRQDVLPKMYTDKAAGIRFPISLCTIQHPGCWTPGVKLFTL